MTATERNVHPLVGLAIVAGGVAAIVLAAYGWAASEQPELLVENGTSAEVHVAVDDEPAVAVATGSVARLPIGPGHHTVRIDGADRARPFDVRPSDPHSWLLHLGELPSFVLVASYGPVDDAPLVGSRAVRIEGAEDLGELPVRHVEIDGRIACSAISTTVAIGHLCRTTADERVGCTCDDACASVCVEAFAVR